MEYFITNNIMSNKIVHFKVLIQILCTFVLQGAPYKFYQMLALIIKWVLFTNDMWIHVGLVSTPMNPEIMNQPLYFNQQTTFLYMYVPVHGKILPRWNPANATASENFEINCKKCNVSPTTTPTCNNVELAKDHRHRKRIKYSRTEKFRMRRHRKGFKNGLGSSP